MGVADSGKADGARRTRRPRKPTPEEALQRTHELLEAHNEQAKQVPAWRLLEGGQGGGTVPAPTEASPELAARQNELHMAETRSKAIQGSASIQDRRNQRRRDQR